MINKLYKKYKNQNNKVSVDSAFKFKYTIITS